MSLGAVRGTSKEIPRSYKKERQKIEEVCGSAEQLPHCCGVTDLGSFGVRRGRLQDDVDEYSGDYYEVDWDDDRTNEADLLEDCLESSGTGLFTATFINSPECKAAYKLLKEKMKILFQSKPYRNNNSGRDVFLVVYTARFDNVPR